MASREALYVVTESAYGTPTATPVLNTDAWYFNLPDSDSFSGVMSPVFQEIPFGGGLDTLLDVRSDHNQTQLNWKGIVYPSVDNFLLNLSLQLINSGQTAPWATTEEPGDLASASFFKLWKARGSAAQRKRFPGCKVMTLSFDCSRQDPRLRFTVQLAAQKEDGNPIDSSTDPTEIEFPVPADTAIPTGPYLFSHSATNLSVGGTSVTNYVSVSLKVTNKLDVVICENNFPSVIACHGRRIDLTFQRILSGSPNYRTVFQGLTDKATYLKFDNGTSSWKVDLGAKCHVSAYAQQLGLGKEFLETVTITGRYDATNGTDCTLTFT